MSLQAVREHQRFRDGRVGGRPLSIFDARIFGIDRTIASYAPNGRNRRVSLVAARSGDGLLSEPIAGACPRHRELVFMPLTGSSAQSRWLPEPVIRPPLIQ